MKRLVALLICAFAMNVLGFDSQGETAHALEHVTASYHAHADGVDQSNVPSNSTATETAGAHDHHCAHSANCSFIARPSNSIALTVLPDAAFSPASDVAFVTVFLEDPSKPPSA